MMKKNIAIRILAALGGVTLWMLGLCALAETFFGVQLTAYAGRILAAGTPLKVLAVLIGAALLCAFGVCCLLMLSAKRSGRRKGFVMQKGEDGVIGVSIKSIEGLVFTCVKQHEVITAAEISVVEKRDGIVILLDIQEAAGVNIPLAVGALQKQIKEYVTTCTGVDVHEVRVMVENTENAPAESPYAVKEPAAPVAAETPREIPTAEAAAEMQTEEAVPLNAVMNEDTAAAEAQIAEVQPAQETVSMPMPVAAPPIPPMPVMVEEEDERPLHQRLFGAEDEPVFVPMPPEMIVEPIAEEAAEEAAPETPAEEPVEAAGEDGMDANAVLDVVNAMATEEESLPEEDSGSEETLAEDPTAEAEDELPKE